MWTRIVGELVRHIWEYDGICKALLRMEFLQGKSLRLAMRWGCLKLIPQSGWFWPQKTVDEVHPHDMWVPGTFSDSRAHTMVQTGSQLTWSYPTKPGPMADISLEDGPSLYPHAEACPKVAPPNWWRDRPVVSVLGLSHLMMGEATGRRIYDHQGLFTTNPRWNGTSRCCLCQLVSDDEVTTLVRQVLMRIHIQAGTILNCFWKGQNSDSVTNSGEFSTNSQTFESCPRYLLCVSRSYSIYVCTLHILAEVVAYHRPLVYTSLQLLHNSPNFSVILPMFSGEIADS